MELYEVMHTTFAARTFTDDPLPDYVLFRILDHARFAPSGGNRQGWHVVIVRDSAIRRAIADLGLPAAKRYMAQNLAGECPWNSIRPTSVDAETIERTQVPAPFIDPFLQAPVVLVVCADLNLVASLDMELDRVGIVGGASIYPFAWNILLAARHEGYGGTLTTLAVAQEPKLRSLLGLPDDVAACALMPLGRPTQQITKLRRKPVEDFTHIGRWEGKALRAR